MRAFLLMLVSMVMLSSCASSKLFGTPSSESYYNSSYYTYKGDKYFLMLSMKYGSPYLVVHTHNMPTTNKESIRKIFYKPAYKLAKERCPAKLSFDNMVFKTAVSGYDTHGQNDILEMTFKCSVPLKYAFLKNK